MSRKRNRREIVCTECGQPFTIPISRGRAHFCSYECLKIYGARENWVIKTCLQCGKEFTVRKSFRTQKYCGKSCAMTARNLTGQNPSYGRDISGDKNPMYGKGRSGKDNPMYGKTREQNPAFRGGRKIRKDGYILVLAPDDHPCRIGAIDPTVYILEHRLIMEQHLGRYLGPFEVVHHLDGNPTNNVIENLHLYECQADHVHDGHNNNRKAKKE